MLCGSVTRKLSNWQLDSETMDLPSPHVRKLSLWWFRYKIWLLECSTYWDYTEFIIKNIILTYYFKEIKTEKSSNHFYASRNERGKNYLFTFSVFIFEKRRTQRHLYSVSVISCPISDHKYLGLGRRAETSRPKK